LVLAMVEKAEPITPALVFVPNTSELVGVVLVAVVEVLAGLELPVVVDDPVLEPEPDEAGGVAVWV